MRECRAREGLALSCGSWGQDWDLLILIRDRAGNLYSKAPNRHTCDPIRQTREKLFRQGGHLTRLPLPTEKALERPPQHRMVSATSPHLPASRTIKLSNVQKEKVILLFDLK